ncbi:Mannosyltransferase [Fasciola gigantica]|uniref:Mannosyltransferase n=1 Tax=Fasciola gigantica TaxID=46835 RepID=A0A504YCJ8_FASGI|nr:Mannosyltransferase [Fasciola gigantica]
MASFHIPVCVTQVWSRLFVNEYKLFAFLVVFRLFNALIQQTAFVPDEFWQSIEVAHHWVFGYGSFTWEWRPDVALRSPLHPMLIAVVYWLGKLIHMDSALFVLLVPRILHAFLAALADLHLYRLSIQLAGPETAKVRLCLQGVEYRQFILDKGLSAVDLLIPCFERLCDFISDSIEIKIRTLYILQHVMLTSVLLNFLHVTQRGFPLSSLITRGVP